MVVHDEETLSEALLLVDSGPIRYSDEYAYTVITNRDTLEARCRSVLERGSVAVIVPLGMESEMEDHSASLRRVQKQRKLGEQKVIREYIREHPERVEKVEEHLKKKGGQ